jgi:hypothetical protein
MWCVPEIDQEFVVRMEDVLRLHARPRLVPKPRSTKLSEESWCLVRVEHGLYERDLAAYKAGRAA